MTPPGEPSGKSVQPRGPGRDLRDEVLGCDQDPQALTLCAFCRLADRDDRARSGERERRLGIGVIDLNLVI
jgi:hypothetical protein